MQIQQIQKLGLKGDILTDENTIK
ncbi:MAG: Type IV secretory pathway VirB4 components-like protein, partial [Candidatus Doudnabacteria bacterium Gr01-1014_77]